MLALRPIAAADAGWLDGWLAPVAASVGYSELDGEHAGGRLLERLHVKRGLHVRIVVRDGDAVGLAVYRVHAPRDGAAIVEMVATRPEYARRGSGMAAVAGVEDALRQQGVRIVYAPAPAVHGIAAYFWIRLGYRPLLRAEWPCARAGVAWFTREL
jgi:GNAT superfamily N-acetyltransferase